MKSFLVAIHASAGSSNRIMFVLNITVNFTQKQKAARASPQTPLGELSATGSTLPSGIARGGDICLQAQGFMGAKIDNLHR